MKSGFLFVNKPIKLTSSDLVLKVKKVLNLKKIGHTGTLDKLAQGLLILPFGNYTCFSELFLKKDKTYSFTIKYGISTDSGDLDGNILEKWETNLQRNAISKRKADIEQALKSTINWKTQTAPVISALKFKGKRQAELFRKGLPVTEKKRNIIIHNVTITESNLNTISGIVSVSSGTYIRKIVIDLSNQLKIPMVLNSLTREKIGNYSLKDANTIKQIEDQKYRIFSLQELVDFPSIIINDEFEKNIANGQKLNFHKKLNQLFFIRGKSGKLFAWCEPSDSNIKKYKYKKVFV